MVSLLVYGNANLYFVMKKKKTIYIENSLWDKVKWLSQYLSKKARKSCVFNDCITDILE